MRIRTISRGQSKEAAAVAAAAFANDPIWRHTLPNPRRRGYPHTILLRASLRSVPPDHVVRVAEHDDRIAGLAFWGQDGTIRPPESPEVMDPAILRAARTMSRRLGRDRFRLATMYTALARSNPYNQGWFLGTLVVHPEHQRKGIGSALLRDGLAQADLGEHPVTLQTSSPENVRFYQRHGFEVTEMLDELYPGAPALWTMRRPSAAVGHRT